MDNEPSAPRESATIRKVADDLWVADAPLRLLKVHVGTRATICRLPDGGLWVHSPVRLDPGLQDAVGALGPVRHLVGPNRFHHLYLRQWVRAWPEASVWLAQGLGDKRPDLAEYPAMGNQPPDSWGGALAVHRVSGIPGFSESVFFHHPSSTLIVTDLLFNIRGGPAWTRLFFRLNGAYGRPAASRILRSLIRDRAALRTSIDRILEWPIERIHLAHGELVESGGAEALRRAYAFLPATGG